MLFINEKLSALLVAFPESAATGDVVSAGMLIGLSEDVSAVFGSFAGGIGALTGADLKTGLGEGCGVGILSVMITRGADSDAEGDCADTSRAATKIRPRVKLLFIIYRHGECVGRHFCVPTRVASTFKILAK